MNDTVLCCFRVFDNNEGPEKGGGGGVHVPFPSLKVVQIFLNRIFPMKSKPLC